ncbi:52 kDa repressor of the inhibitor of the protein kinase-like [Mya arenaria]|uniref:52 kDa repressor of the inhibitor of the protein kinase-like n=1 Tax=Mya arenaria TaxID=6604 RepID=UPI0022E1B3DE|nr:52 kDa repressor of the inhibitor of the protein kinase-like [Mya arenaria]
MKSEAHLSNCDSPDHFLAIMKGEKKDILCNMSSQYNVAVEKNRKILVSITEAIVFCGKQNIALRGHEGDKGKFQALLRFQAKQDPILKEHLEHGDPRSMYLSPDIQNELISICGKQIADSIVSKCNSAPCFGFMADEATYASTMEQMAMGLRYFDGADLRDDFLGFAECESTTGETLANAFLANL